MLLSCIRKGAFLHVHILPRKPERCKTGAAWFRRLGRCCTKDLFVSGPGGRCHRSVPAALPPERAPPISPARKPRAAAAQTRSYFSGEPETAQPPKTDGFVLPILLEKQYSALFTTLLKAPVKTITAGKPRPEYSAYPPVSTQIDAKNFRQDKSIHILPKHKTDAFRNMQKASAVKNYFNLRQS